MRHDHSIRPVLLAVAAIALLTCMDALAKHLSAEFHTFQIVMLRYAFTVAFMVVLVAVQRPGLPRRDRLAAHAGRAALSVVTASSFFYAVGHLPLADTFALSFTAPLFIALFGALFLKEKLRWSISAALVLGFIGMLVIVFADTRIEAGERNTLAVACALISPVAYALGIVLLRSQTAHEPTTVIVFVQSILVTIFVSPLAALDFRAADGTALATFALAGLLGGIGHLALAAALARTTAARFSVAEYTGLLWAALLGYLFFAEVPALAVWIGAALIIGGCALVARERKPVAPDVPT